MTTEATTQQPIRSTIPARLDRLRWSPFHTRLVLGLGTAWVLDGLSVTIASSVTGKLTQANTLNLTTTQAASIGTVYLVGEVVGALFFGRLSDQLAGAGCSCGRSWSTWAAPRSPRSLPRAPAGSSTYMRRGSSPGPASAVSMRPSIPRSTK